MNTTIWALPLNPETPLPLPCDTCDVGMWWRSGGQRAWHCWHCCPPSPSELSQSVQMTTHYQEGPLLPVTQAVRAEAAQQADFFSEEKGELS